MKGKPDICVYLLKWQPAARLFAALCAFGIACTLIWIGSGGTPISRGPGSIFVDHLTQVPSLADNLHVKVLPSDISDQSLNVLPKDSFSYAAVIDAGSSGSRVHVYRYGRLGSESGQLYVLPNHQSYKEKPGLSSYADNPDDANKSMTALVDFMKKIVPQELWAETPLWLKATAGMRLLPQDKSDAVYANVRKYLMNKEQCPFLFDPSWAKTIPGNDEGAFGWIAFNYLMKLVGPKRASDATSPYAVVEMGGASAQVTAQSTPDELESIPPDGKFSISLAGQTYLLYTHSYLGYGGEQARETLSKSLQPDSAEGSIADPCLNMGYSRSKDTVRKDPFDGTALPGVAVEGAADKASCTKAIKDKVINKVEQKNCVRLSLRGSLYTMDCQYQPKFVDSTENFLVFENFFWAASGTNVMKADHSNKDLDQKMSFPLVTTAKEFRDSSMDVCGKTWEQITKEYPVDGSSKDNNNKWCFMLSYAASFLIDGLKLPTTKKVTVQRMVGDSEIEWALGAVYKELEDLLKKQPPSSLRSVPSPNVYMDEKRLTMESSSNDKPKEPLAPAVQEGELVKESDVINTAEEKMETTKSAD